MEGLIPLQNKQTVSLTRARQLVPGCQLTDAELETLLAQLEALADISYSMAKKAFRERPGSIYANCKT